jgi:hypothetical protein
MKLNSKVIYSLEQAVKTPLDSMVRTYANTVLGGKGWATEYNIVQCLFIVGVRWNHDNEEVGVCYELLNNGKFYIILWDFDFTCDTEDEMLNYIETHF